MTNKHSKYTIRTIFKTHWESFVVRNFSKKQHLFRKTVFTNITKLINCKQAMFAKYSCSKHPTEHTLVPFTCKSRSCSTCNVQATNNWSKWLNNVFPNKQALHINFSIPAELGVFFYHPKLRGGYFSINIVNVKEKFSMVVTAIPQNLFHH